MRPSPAQYQILIAMQAGGRLRVERTLDGAKAYRIYAPDNPEGEELGVALVQSMERAGLIESNMKFPAATFMLTDAGVGLAAQLTGSTVEPVGPRRFV
jgi:hypothetical protein